MRSKTLTPVHRVRRRIVARLVRKRFGGNASQASRALGFSHQYLWQLLSGRRGMGEVSARRIERKLKLPAYTLDGAAPSVVLYTEEASAECLRIGNALVRLSRLLRPKSLTS